MKVGERYRVRDREDIMDEYRCKIFTIQHVYNDYVIIVLDDETEGSHTIDLCEWTSITESISQWDGNILKHRFI